MSVPTGSRADEGAVLIWLNGPFGVGKTRVARRLVRLRRDFRLFDPEKIGFALRRIPGNEHVEDFRDLPAWRAATLRTLVAAGSADPARTLVVPMCLTDPEHHREIVGGLGAAGIHVRHFSLMAPAATVRRRNRLRLMWPASKRWALDRVEPCLAALQSETFAVHVDTEERPVAAIAEEILARVEAKA